MAAPVSHDPRMLMNPVLAPSSLGTFYTSPSAAGARGTLIIGIYVLNINASLSRDYTLHHVPSGGSAGDDNYVVNAFTLVGGTTGVGKAVYGAGILMEPGDTLEHFASVASQVAVHAYGIEMSDSASPGDPVSYDPIELARLELAGGLPTIYTSPTGAGKRGTRVRSVEWGDVTGGTHATVVSLYHLQAGGVAATDPEGLIMAQSIFTGTTVPFVYPAGIVMNPGDFLAVSGGPANLINVKAYGWEMTD